ncbi:E3 ubiquitin-protein ligase UPL5-like [Papaver somniferum]|uniref:E3 ubiquitin-protein ligase UPL5-like n=1 Tax=Papaver somniferum TaxID=3469 RepID=UPI000E70482D|nr:E3 ubiquitin-protein ligase UPL5-like [Papaver somniferum]
MASKLVRRSEEETEAAKDLVSSIASLCSLCESDPSSGSAEALVSLVLNSPTQCYKQAAEESIKLFLYPNIRSMPKLIRKHCVRESSHTKVHTSLRLSIENDVQLLTFFSRYVIRAIEDHVILKGQSLPLDMDDDIFEQPCYLGEILFLENMYDDLNLEFIQCLAEVKGNVWYGRFFDHTPTWPSYLSVLRELKKFSKIFLNYEKDLLIQVSKYQYQMDILIKLSKRSDDLLWLLPYKNLINPISRDYLLMKMFPGVKLDFEKQHKMLIDRSQILTESFKPLSLATSKSLRCGLSVEFRNEEAVGYGVLREWFFVICQELFDPKAPVVPRELNYFAFAGRVIALALMHEVQVGITFDPVFFYQLAGGVISLEDI